MILQSHFIQNHRQIVAIKCERIIPKPICLEKKFIIYSENQKLR